MAFPIELTSRIGVGEKHQYAIKINSGFTVLIGPNGSGKTQFLRGLKPSIAEHAAGKKVRLMSAGRIGTLEAFRSNYNGAYDQPRYDQISFGNYDDVRRRHDSETLHGDFQVLSARPDILIKIRERLRKIFRKDIDLSWSSQGSLKVLFSTLAERTHAYSSGSEASGLLHLVGLLTALYDDEVGVLLIDEPEISLHPQLQAFLLKEMLAVSGVPEPKSYRKIIVCSTHSTEFIKVRKPIDLTNLIFFNDIGTSPVQISPDAGELKGASMASLANRMGQEHKLALFARSPLLVEGPSDAIICAALTGKAGIDLDAGGSQILPVIGKGQFPVVVKLLRMMGKFPIVLADADAIADGLELANTYLNNESANAAAASRGARSAIELAGSVYSDFCLLVEAKFGEVSNLATQHPYWLTREEGQSEIIAQRRATLAVLLSTDDATLASLNVHNVWLAMKARFIALLDILAGQGCHVLRRGEIEDYYTIDLAGNNDDKVKIAAKESEVIAEYEESALELRYGDVLKCIRQAASWTPIVEAEGVRDMVLAVAAPALARLKDGGKVGSPSAIFKRANVDIVSLSINGGNLVIDLNSNVLEVTGFPIVVGPNDNIVSVVSKALNL